MLDSTYLIVSGHAFVTPPNLGLLPIVPADTTTVIAYELVRQDKSSLKTYHEVKNIDRALKKLIIEKIDNVYTDDLRDPNIGFAGTIAMDLITHLYDYFGKISVVDIAKNEETTLSPYDSFRPITRLFSQIEEVVSYAEAEWTPFANEYILQKTYLLVLKAGVYGEDFCSWIRRPIIETTWPTFKPHFILAYTSLCETQIATKDFTFNSANAAITNKQSEAINALATN